MRSNHFCYFATLTALLISADLMGQESELLVRFKNPTTQIQASAFSEIESADTIQEAQDARETFIKSLLNGFNQDVSQSEGFSAAIQAVGGGDLKVIPNTDGYMRENSTIEVFAAAASQSVIITPKAGSDGAIATIVAQLQNSDDVEYVELPFIQGFPIDLPVFAAPQDTASETWARNRVGADQLSSELTGRGVKVAILDSGIHRSHPDFSGIDVAPGVSFTATSATSDTIGHGTFVAGIVAGRRVGIAKNATLIPYQIFSAGRNSSLSPMKAFERALADGVDVVNMSIGMPNVGTSGRSSVVLRAWDDAFEKAKLANVIHVSAAGNHEDRHVQALYTSMGFGQDFGDVLLPGGSTKTICVAATTNESTNPTAGFSRPISGVDNRTVRPVDISAPGQEVFSATLNGHYATGSGTSFATPYVTGAMALLREKNPRITQEQALSLLRSTAKPLSNRNRQGAGILDLPRLLDDDGGGGGGGEGGGSNDRQDRIARLDKNIVALTDVRNYWAHRVGRSIDSNSIDAKTMEELRLLRSEVPRLQREIVRLNKERPDLKGTEPFPGPGSPGGKVPAPPDSVTFQLGKDLATTAGELRETNKVLKEFSDNTTTAIKGLEEANNNLVAFLAFSFEPTGTAKAQCSVTLPDKSEITFDKPTPVRVLKAQKSSDSDMVFIQFLTESGDKENLGSPVINVGTTLGSNIELIPAAVKEGAPAAEKN